MKFKIRKGASVKVITGSDKGKQGTVLDVDAKAMRVKVEGVKIMTKHTKEHGIKKAEGYIHYSNVAFLAEVFFFAAASTCCPLNISVF